MKLPEYTMPYVYKNVSKHGLLPKFTAL